MKSEMSFFIDKYVIVIIQLCEDLKELTNLGISQTRVFFDSTPSPYSSALSFPPSVYFGPQV